MKFAAAKATMKRAPTYANIAYVVFRQVLNPADIRPMFRLRDLIDLPGFKLVMDKVRMDPGTAANIRDRYLSGPHDLDALSQLPEGTLGHAHAKFMRHCLVRPGKSPPWRSSTKRRANGSLHTPRESRFPQVTTLPLAGALQAPLD